MPSGWSWLAYTLEQPDVGPLRCLEASRSGTAAEPTGVLSRWGADTAPDSIPDLVVESAVPDATVDEAELAVRGLRAWLSNARAMLGDWSEEGFRTDDLVRPDTVERVADALVVDGAALPGTLARRGGLTARVVRRPDHVVTVAHGAAVPPPIRLVAGMPTVSQSLM
ncbi:hypothetical protein [Cellulomonas sp. Marseille-Q8402]